MGPSAEGFDEAVCIRVYTAVYWVSMGNGAKPLLGPQLHRA